MIDTLTAQQEGEHHTLLRLATVPVDMEKPNSFGLPQEFVLSAKLGERVPLTAKKTARTGIGTHPYLPTPSPSPTPDPSIGGEGGEGGGDAIFPQRPAFGGHPVHGQTIDELFLRQQQAALKDLSRNPENPHLLTNAGVSYLKAGELETAKRYFEQALRRDATFLKAQLNLAKVYRLQGNIERAIEIYVTLQGQYPTHPSVIENLVSLYLEKGESESCWPLLEKLLKEKPSNPSGYFLKAILLLTEGKVENAVSALRKAARLDLHQPAVHNCLGVCYAILGNLEKAIRSFQTALTIAFGDRAATLNLARAYEGAGRLSDALQLLAAYVERHETDWDARDLLAQALFLSGDYQSSLSHLLRIKESVSQCLFGKTQGEARSVGSQAQESNCGELIRLSHNLALVYAKLGQVDKAMECYERCLAFQPEKPLVYFNFAMFLLDGKYFFRADEVIKEMAVKFPNDAAVTLLKGRYFFEQEQFDAAFDYLQGAVKHRPADLLAACLLGYIFSEVQQDYHAAIATFKEALTHHPTDARLLNNLAYNYLMADEVESARQVLDLVNEADSPIFLAATWGLLRLKEDKPLEGRRLYNQAAKLAPNSKLRRRILQKKALEVAKYELKKNRPGQAMKHLKKIIQLQDPDPVFKKQAIFLLQRLEA